MRGFVGMAVRQAKLYSGALLLRTRSVDYSLLAKLRFWVPGGPWQALEETPACTVTFSGASFSPAVGRGFSKVAAPAVVFFLHLRPRLSECHARPRASSLSFTIAPKSKRWSSASAPAVWAMASKALVISSFGRSRLAALFKLKTIW